MAGGLFFVDACGRRVSCGDFCALCAGEAVYTPYCAGGAPDVFKSLLMSLVFDAELTLLDSSLTAPELEDMLGFSDVRARAIPAPRADWQAVASALSSRALADILPLKNWRLRLFTSGSEGRPKSVLHDFSSISKSLKVSPRHFGDVWGFAYNPAHMAGVQVFLQALFNGNALVDLFALPPAEIFARIAAENITHISASPSFYRLLAGGGGEFPSVLRLVSGGEAFDAPAMERLKKIFPRAKILNAYASTEFGGMMFSSGDYFELPPDMKVENGELFALSRLGGCGGKIWRPTGDMAEFAPGSRSKIRISGRRGDMLNVGGYKVNPLEVEAALRAVAGVSDALVYGVANKVLGCIVGADVVASGEVCEASIRKALQARLQNFKIPRIINFVEKLEKTATGKTRRRR